jgi:putative transposase
MTDRSNYYLWTRAQERRDERERKEREFAELIREIHTAHPACGAEWITRELKRQGFMIGRCRVARLMREQGISGITRRKHRSLTKPDRGSAAVGSSPRRCPA